MSNQNIADVYVEPQSALGYQGGALNNSYDYNLSVSNGGEIYSINGVSITPATSVSLQYTPGTGYQVNGSSTVISSINRALPEDFEVGVINSNTGATTLTVQSVGVSSTAEIDFVAGAPVKVAHFSPSASTLNLGQTEMVTFQIQDVNGNPVPNTAVGIEDDQSPYDPFWVTGVNGVALQENFETSNNTSVVQPTPIPLGQLTTVAPNLNYSVAMLP